MKFSYRLSAGILILTAAILALVLGVSFLISPDQGYNRDTNNAEVKHTLSGKVINSQNQAIADARVTILPKPGKTRDQAKAERDDSGSKATVTDENGTYKIENISSGTYTHKVEADGYETLKQQITINEDENLSVKLKSSQP